MNLVAASLRNPYLVVVAALGLVVLGVTALTGLSTDLLPIFKAPAVQIVTLYPGMPPEVVEKDITSRLERWTGQSVGIEHQEARSMLGVSIVKDFFREDIDPNSAMSQVTSLAVSDMFYLPPGTLPPMVMPFDPTASVPLCLLSVSSPTMTEKELYDVAYYEMRNRLQAIQGVIAPAVYGGVLRRILAYVDRDKLHARNMSPMDVVRGLRDQNVFVPTGNAKIGETDYLILSNAMVQEIAELNNAPLRVDEDGPVFLGDVAEMKDTNQIQSNIVRINGRRQVYIPVYRQPGANTLAIVDEVKARSQRILQRIRELDPKAHDLSMDVVMDQSVLVRDSIGGITWSALIGGVLVVLIVLLFLRSVRSSLIVLAAIPMAILGSLTALYFTGSTLNAMTLGGLALAIGILIDQAIVVVENVTRHLGMGKTPGQAALDGTREVALPIFVASITFVVVFYPVVFLSGMAGFLFRPLALAVVAATITSYLVATTLVPVACSVLLKAKAKQHDGSFDRMANSYGGVVHMIQRMRWPVIVITVIVFALSLLLARGLGTELFPPVDSGQFTVLMRGRAGTRIEITEKMTAEVEKVIQQEVGAIDQEGKNPESDLRLLLANIGVLYDWPAAYTPNTGPMDSFLLVQLKEDRQKTAQQHASHLRQVLPDKFPGIEFSFDTGGMLTAALNLGLPSPINIKVQGTKLEEAHAIAEAIAAVVKDVPGAVDVRVAQPLDYPALRIEVDRVKAGFLGITQDEVIKNIVTALNSSVNFAPAFWISPKNGNHYFMGAQYREEEIESVETLMDIPISMMTKSGVPQTALLKDIARIERTKAPAVIDHRNITRTIDVYANVAGRAVGSVAEDMEALLASSPQFLQLKEDFESRGYRYEFYGEVASMRDSFRQLLFGFLTAAILVYLVMVAQLRSFLLPLVIMGTVPLGLIGVVLALWLTGTNFGIPALMGLILMVGIVVQYSVLLVDFAVRLQREGVEIGEAVREAARQRIRPVLMTASTTALALLPLALGVIPGSESNVPLARAMLGAVAGGSVLALLVVPALYAVVGKHLHIRAETAPSLT
tara:strand:- start:10755 stop:13940 length:3186 start_codon:yes stop_codon:yes gene_type:complete